MSTGRPKGCCNSKGPLERARRRAAKQRRYQQSHRAQLAAYMRDYLAAHPEKRRTAQANWRAANPEKDAENRTRDVLRKAIANPEFLLTGKYGFAALDILRHDRIASESKSPLELLMEKEEEGPA